MSGPLAVETSKCLHDTYDEVYNERVMGMGYQWLHTVPVTMSWECSVPPAHTIATRSYCQTSVYSLENVPFSFENSINFRTLFEIDICM